MPQFPPDDALLPSASMPVEVLCLGEAMVMVTPTEPSPLEDAELFRLAVGGAESTVAMYLAEAGFRSSWVSAVGDDPLGLRVVRAVAAAGVDVSFVQRNAKAPTGVYFKDPGTGSTRVHYYRKGSAAAAMSTGVLDALPLDTVHLVHASGITPGLSDSCLELMRALAARVRSSTALLSFDVNYRPGVWTVEEAAPVLLELARQADYVFVGRDEAEVLWNTPDAASIRDFVRPAGKLIVKDGSVGATELSARGEVFVASPVLEVVEAVGAGDAFAAGYLAAELRGSTAEAALRNGHRLAARTLQSTADFVSGQSSRERPATTN